MAIDVQPVAAPPQPPAFTTASASTSFDERWAAWQAKGAVHDRAVRRKIAIAAPILIIVAAVIILAVLGR